MVPIVWATLEVAQGGEPSQAGRYMAEVHPHNGRHLPDFKGLGLVETEAFQGDSVDNQIPAFQASIAVGGDSGCGDHIRHGA